MFVYLMLLCVYVAKSLCHGLMTSIIWDCRTVAMWWGKQFGFSTGCGTVLYIMTQCLKAMQNEVETELGTKVKEWVCNLFKPSVHLNVSDDQCVCVCVSVIVLLCVCVSLLDTCVMRKSKKMFILFFIFLDCWNADDSLSLLWVNYYREISLISLFLF